MCKGRRFAGSIDEGTSPILATHIAARTIRARSELTGSVLEGTQAFLGALGAFAAIIVAQGHTAVVLEAAETSFRTLRAVLAVGVGDRSTDLEALTAIEGSPVQQELGLATPVSGAGIGTTGIHAALAAILFGAQATLQTIGALLAVFVTVRDAVGVVSF